MFQIFRGKVCNVAELPGGRSARRKVCNTTPELLNASNYRELNQGSRRKYCKYFHLHDDHFRCSVYETVVIDRS